MSNTRLSERYLALARDLDVLEPKLPEDVYKMHLVDTQRGGLAPSLDSAAKNLSATLVNALVNLGFGNDKLVTPATQEGERSWVSRNKDHGKTCAVASIGVCCFVSAVISLGCCSCLPRFQFPARCTTALVRVGLCQCTEILTVVAVMVVSGSCHNKDTMPTTEKRSPKFFSMLQFSWLLSALPNYRGWGTLLDGVVVPFEDIGCLPCMLAAFSVLSCWVSKTPSCSPVHLLKSSPQFTLTRATGAHCCTFAGLVYAHAGRQM
jgi:hypothetical protein